MRDWRADMRHLHAMHRMAEGPKRKLSSAQFLKRVRYAKRAGGAGRTARMRKKQMKAACSLWFGVDMNELFNVSRLSNWELAS